MGTIFGGMVEFTDDKDFDDFVNTIDYQNSVRLLELSLNYAIKHGIFEMNECHTIYKCLSKIKKENEEK